MNSTTETEIPVAPDTDSASAAPSRSAASPIEVTDRGDRRHVRILRPQKGSSYSNVSEFDTAWPAEMLRRLADLKGDWFLDSYQRFEHPNYIQKQIDVVLELYGIKLAGTPVLDFGCGFGASSYCMIKRGATDILAADLEKSNTDFAADFARAMGFADRVAIRHGDVVPELQPNSFGVIWLQAVMEHLLPSERQSYLKRFWQALRPGGHLIITETPNRVWPVEGHTTRGTWWIPWMSHQKVFRRMRTQERYASYSDEDFYRCGIIGSSYREILDCLGRPADCRELSLETRGYASYLYSRAARRSPARAAATKFLGAAEFLSRNVLRRPITSFMPFLQHLAFQKRSADAR